VLEGREAALREARDQALQSARSKAEFAANVSHELRTPMNGVLGMLDLLVDSGMQGRQREFIAIAKNSAESLLVLIDDLLNFSKNEAGKAALEMRDFVLEQPLKELVILLAPPVQKKNINLVYATDVDIPLT
jgi:signal transduction histidine kinase